jgi:glycosyltransferase involved in cell wall biosynthesis
VIATRNEQEYIVPTLRNLSSSIAHAKERNITAEIIIVDSSNDDTPNLARKFTEKVYHFAEKGVSKARNHGTQFSQGRVLVFMDADTIVQKSTLFEIFRTLQDKSVSSAIASVLPLDYSELSFSAKLFYAIDRLYVKACDLISPLTRFYNRGDIAAVRRADFEKIGGFDKKLHMMEITNLLVKASKFGRVKVLSKPVFESSRRLRNWGLVKSYKIWWRNYFTFYVFKRLYDAQYEAVR